MLSEFLDDNGRAVVPLHKLPCVLFIRDMDLSANFAGESILTCKVMHCLFLIILLQIFEQNWDQVRAKRLRRAPWFVGLEATCMQVRHVNLLCFASNFCFIGPENYEDERIVVFVHVACAQIPAYDGYTATDEVQFPWDISGAEGSAHASSKKEAILLKAADSQPVTPPCATFEPSLIFIVCKSEVTISRLEGSLSSGMLVYK
jgi:hypothetical protein